MRPARRTHLPIPADVRSGPPAARRRRAVAAGVALAIGAAALGACGGDRSQPGDDRAMERSSASTTTTEAPQPPPTPATVIPDPPAPTVPATPAAAATPEELGDRLAAGEAAVRTPGTPDDVLGATAKAHQEAILALVADPSKRDAALARVPAEHRPTVEATLAAGAALRSMIKKPKDTLPAWRIVAPAPPDELLGYYRAAEAQIGVPWSILAGIHLVETRMGRIRGTSVAGARGPMQFMPKTWEAYGEGGDIESNADAILAAARLLKNNGVLVDRRKAVWNYNHDYRYVDAVLTYADQMAADERRYHHYWHWQVQYLTTSGYVLLPEGYGA